MARKSGCLQRNSQFIKMALLKEINRSRQHGSVGIGQLPYTPFVEGRPITNSGEPIATRSHEASTRRMLGEMVRAERKASSMGKYEGYESDPIEGFEKGPDFESFLGEAVPMVEVFFNNESGDESQFIGRLRARLLEILAHSFLSAAVKKEGGVVISPEDTFTLFAELNPNRDSMTDAFQMGLQGISVPDGLQVDQNGKIVRVFEYTSNLTKKADGIQLGGYKRDIAQRVILDGAGIMVVHTPHRLAKKGRGGFKGTSLIELPFTNGDLDDLGRAVYERSLIRAGFMASSRDVDARLRYQDGKYLDGSYDERSFPQGTVAEYAFKRGLSVEVEIFPQG